MTFNSLQMH